MSAIARRTTFIMALASVTGIAACTRGDTASGSADSAGTASAPGASQPMSGMEGMPGMGGMQGGMMGRMQAHMAMMDGISGDSIRALLPTHRQMAANTLSTMNREMREMNMAGDAAWTATVDSLRQDLVTLPELSGSQLLSFMPAHNARMMRLMAMHQRMMKDMAK
jgi:hypothetical protein